MSALLLQIALKASVVFMLTWVTTLMMRRHSAAARHMVWTLGISAALLLPVVGATTPPLNVSMPPDQVIVPVPEATDPLPVMVSEIEPDASASLASPPAGTPDPAPDRSVSTTTILAALWVGGAVVALIKLAVGFLRVRAITSGASTVDDEVWLAETARAASAFDLRTRIAVRQTARTAVPLVCGIWRPTILLPLSADEWTAERRRVVLLHESAHVKRHDCATLALTRLVVALHWFNPLAYVALKRLRTEQERAADDLVLTAGTDASVYADHLLEIARAFRTADPAGATALAMARPSDIEGRLMAILEPSRSRRPLSRAARSAAAAASALALMPLAALQVSASTPATAMQVPAPRWSAMPRALEVPPPVAVEFSQAVPAPRPNPPGQTAAPPAPPAPPAPVDRPDEATRKRIADALMGALDDSSQRVREQALDTLASMRDERAIPALIKALGDSAPEVRERAAAALGNMRDSRAVAPLVQALRDANANVRRRAAGALGTIADPMAVDALTAALKDADPRVREQAAQSLGRIARGRSSASASVSQSFDVNLSASWNDALREFEAHREDLDKLQDDLKNWRLLMPPSPPTPASPPTVPR
jgi:beta-lactamase regulating signal transducer with metallopeptidase domain